MSIKRLDVVVEWWWRLPLGAVDPERDVPAGVRELFERHCDLLAEELLEPVGVGAAALIARRSAQLRPVLLDLYRSASELDRAEIEGAARRLCLPGNAVRLRSRSGTVVFETPPGCLPAPSEGPVWVGSAGSTHYVVHADRGRPQAYAVVASRSEAASEVALALHLELEETAQDARALEEENEHLAGELEAARRAAADLQEQLDLLHLAVSGGVRTRLIKGHRDAELVAAEWMTAFGFEDVRLTPPGSDAGIDVQSRDGFAQVKLEAHRTGRPALQQLVGACAHRPGRLLFFSNTGFTAQALEYAEARGIAAFEYDFSGLPRPRSSAAREVSAPPPAVVAEVPAQAGAAPAPSPSDNLNIHDLPASWRR